MGGRGWLTGKDQAKGTSSLDICISLACDQRPANFLSCLALPPTHPPVSWEITMSDLEEKNVNEFSSSGLKCPTCFAVKGRKCSPELKWCPTDKIKCVEFSGIINTGAFLG